MVSEIASLVEHPWCDTCAAHVVHTPFWEQLLSRACYWLAIHWPNRIAFTRAHYAILPWAGKIAYRCQCRAPIDPAMTGTVGE